jgi:NhaP-type Na+/H+ or K+/H+ antiporter
MLEGESLFNDASSLTLFEIFKEVVLLKEHKVRVSHYVYLSSPAPIHKSA